MTLNENLAILTSLFTTNNVIATVYNLKMLFGKIPMPFTSPRQQFHFETCSLVIDITSKSDWKQTRLQQKLVENYFPFRRANLDYSNSLLCSHRCADVET